MENEMMPEEAEYTAGGEAMSDDELAALLSAHENQAVGYYDSEIAAEQARAIDYYYGKMDDLPAMEGCSKVVDHSVQVQVDNAIASVLKPFVSSDEIVSFAPRGPEDVAQAEQATEYVNYIINCDNPGFTIFHDWFKDAMLTKIGVVKVWWEDRTRYSTEHAVLDAMEVLRARESESYLRETDNGDGTFSVETQNVVPDGKVTIENVPPEEFLITPYARSIAAAEYVAHKPTNFTRSDLIEMGVDPEVAEGLPAFGSERMSDQREMARYRDESYGSDQRSGLSDKSRDIIAVRDEYARVDYDGDGISELRRVVRVGDIILLNEEVEDAPFALLCPIPMPHKVYGRSIADLAIEGQRINTAVKRQTLDNLYKSNNPRPVINMLSVNEMTLDDVADTAPGAAIRAKSADAITWNVVPFAAQHSIPILEMVARETEERTGIQRKGNGLNPETLDKNSPDTATQAQIDENSRNERAEMIARIFAETGVTRLFKLILRLVVRHQPKERVIRLRNKWVPIDPRGWNPDMDLIISVGLGVGNRSEQIAQAQSVLQAMERLGGTPYAHMIDDSKVFNALKRMFTATGIKNVDDYLVDPAQAPAKPPPQPDPAVMLKAQELQAKQAESAARLQLMQQESALRIQLDRERAQSEMQLAREKMAAEIELERERQAMEAALRMNGEEADIAASRPGGALDQ